MPDSSDNYQLPSWPPTPINRDLWNAVMGSIGDRLRTREELEADFEALIAQGTQASLDYIQATVAPQLANLQTSITLAQEQIDQIIADGIAPNAAKLGGQLPAHYATASALALKADLIYVDQEFVDFATAVQLLLDQKAGSTATLDALSNRVRVDAAQTFTEAQKRQARENLRASVMIPFAWKRSIYSGTNPNTDLIVSVAAAQGNGLYVEAPVTLEKRLNLPWSVGNLGGGMDTGSLAAGKTYHIHAITNGATLDFLASLSLTAPTVPSGWSRVCRVGSVIAEPGSAALYRTRQVGDIVRHFSGVMDRSSAAAASDALLTLSVPKGIRVRPHITAALGVSGSPANTVIYVGGGDNSTATQRIAQGASTTGNAVGALGEITTNVDGQIRFTQQIFDGSVIGSTLITYGWTDPQLENI